MQKIEVEIEVQILCFTNRATGLTKNSTLSGHQNLVALDVDLRFLSYIQDNSTTPKSCKNSRVHDTLLLSKNGPRRNWNNCHTVNQSWKIKLYLTSLSICVFWSRGTLLQLVLEFNIDSEQFRQVRADGNAPISKPKVTSCSRELWSLINFSLCCFERHWLCRTIHLDLIEMQNFVRYSVIVITL